jgi:hypothetical protein
MSVIDVSAGNDWSDVRLESQSDSYGSVYPINGFIYPENTFHPKADNAPKPVFAFMGAPAKS